MRGTAALLLLINGLVLYNALAHDPAVGYDAADHLNYAVCLAGGRLPGPDCSAEFYSPPLPYIPSALVYRWTGRRAAAARAGLLANVGWSVLLTLLLVAFCRLTHRAGSPQERWALILLGAMPVYYRSMAMLRGEPALAALLLLSAYLAVSRGRAAATGGALGLSALCRQWFFLAVPAFAWALARKKGKGLLVCLSVALLVCGWFYARVGGKWATGPQGPPSVSSVVERCLGFDLPAFSDPLGVYRVNELLPVFYADFWTDAQGYFLVYGKDAAGRVVSGAELVRDDAAIDRGNYGTMRRLMILGLFAGLPLTTLMVWGLWRGLKDGALAALIVASSFAGFAVWLEIFSPGQGHVIKATYLLQICPFMALLGAEAAPRLPGRLKPALWAVAACAAFLLVLAPTRFPARPL